MNIEEMSKSRYIQWGYESYKDKETEEIRSDYVDRLNQQDQELALYKKALELACKEMEAHEQGKTLGWLKIQKIKNKFGIGDYKPYYDAFLQKAKEKINE